MKSLLIILGFIFSSSLFAARAPTIAEYKQFANMLRNSNSIKPFIDVIAQGKIDPMISDSENGARLTPGSSIFAVDLMNRFNLDNPIGNEAENITLLKMITQLGLNLNIPQSIDANNSIVLMDIATSQCATSAIDLMISKGAKVANTYWLNTFNKGYNYDPDSVNDLKCSKLTSHLLDSVSVMDLNLAYKFLVDGDSFIQGSKLDQGLNGEIKLKLKGKYGIVFSPRPTSAVPSDQWNKSFPDHFNYPTANANDEHGPHFWELWWPQYSTEEKAWACYASSFDEFYHLLVKLGYSDDQIITKDLINPGARFTFPFGEFAVKTFVPYCDSIRDQIN